VVNATEQKQDFDLRVAGMKLGDSGTLWKLTGGTLDAVNRVGQVAEVKVEESPTSSARGAITVAPISVNIYRFPVQ